MDKLSVKKQIKAKFGSMSNFARAAKVDRYGLQKMFARKEILPGELYTLGKLIKTTRKVGSVNAVDPKKMKLLFAEIEKAGGILKFCSDNPQFNVESLKHIKYKGRKVMGEVVKGLFDHFKIEI